jgi:hypothetical protein
VAVMHCGVSMSSPWVGPMMGVDQRAQWWQWRPRSGGGGSSRKRLSMSQMYDVSAFQPRFLNLATRRCL